MAFPLNVMPLKVIIWFLGCHSRGREPPAPNHDLTRLVAPSFAPSCRRESKRDGLHAAAVVGHWWLPLRRGGASVLGGIRLIAGMREDRARIVLMALPLSVAPLRVIVCFFGAIDVVEKTF